MSIKYNPVVLKRTDPCHASCMSMLSGMNPNGLVQHPISGIERCCKRNPQQIGDVDVPGC